MANKTMSDNMKSLIDGMSYQAMLRTWRFADSENPLIQGETGKYFSRVMTKKRLEVGEEGHVAASKEIGWGA